jgi:hypothetical protein
MIPLEDARWAKLSHAYGSASDIPDLLRKLAENPMPAGDCETEPWFSLWSALCHQGHVYPASYAALPHIVAICLAAPSPIDFSFLQLPASIEAARAAGRGPAVPGDLAAAYGAGLYMLTDCVNAHRASDWDQAMLLSACAALAVAKGHCKVAEAILNLDDDVIGKVNSFDFD